MEAWSEQSGEPSGGVSRGSRRAPRPDAQAGNPPRSPTQPILSRDGSTARWMLNSLQVTLTPRGAELAGRCVLELLKRFEGRQIATLGLTAVPILNSCIMQSGGRYHGLLVRQQRKKHGSLKLIEGPDRSGRADHRASTIRSAPAPRCSSPATR